MGFVVLSALLGGCARGLLQPPSTIPKGEAALVTLTRESTMLGAALSHIVIVDGQEVVALGAGDQYTIPVAAGWRTIGISCGGRAAGSLRERFEAGKEYYFRTGPAGGCPTIRKVTGADLPEIELNLKYATPAAVDSKLFGDSGLVHGSRRFHAEFERMVLTGKDAGWLRTLIKEAIPSTTAGSELKLQGTIDGTKFLAKMKKDKAGWVYVKFEGLTFQSKPEMEEFLAPFSTEDVHEAKLDGSIAGRRLEIKRERGVTRPR